MTEYLAIRVWLELASPADIDMWAEATIATGWERYPQVFEILEADRESKAELFANFVENEVGFSPVSAAGVPYVERVMAHACEQVLSGAMSVPQFCRLIQTLDGAFVSAGAVDVPIPRLLLDLENECHWCRDSWTLKNQPWLEDLIRDALHVLRTDEDEVGT